MFIKELQPGDRFAQSLNGQTVGFEVIAIRNAGRQYQVTFRSSLGESSARYSANACIVATRQ